MKHLLTGLLALSIGLAACGDKKSTPKKDETEEEDDSSSKKKKSSSAEAAQSGAPTGSAAAAAPVVGDPVVLEAAKKVLGCEWDDDEPKYDCEARKEWSKLEALNDGKADSTLIALLDDPDPKMQYIASDGLESNGEKFREDKTMAEKIFAKAEEAKGTKPFLVNIARLAGSVDAEKTGLGERMKGFAKTLQPKEARERFVETAQFRNDELMYDTTMDVAKNDADKDVRYAAVSSFWIGMPTNKREQVCQLWSDTAHDPKAEDRLQSQAAYLAMFTSRGCQNVYDPLLKLLDEKSKTTMDTTSWVMPLYFFVQNDKQTDDQYKEGMRILKVIAENKSNGDSARAQAIEGVARGDKKNAKAWLAKFKGERSEWIKSRVASTEKQIDEDLAKDPKSGERSGGGNGNAATPATPATPAAGGTPAKPATPATPAKPVNTGKPTKPNKGGLVKPHR